MNELPTVRRLIQDGIDDGLHFGAQVYVSRRGRTVADFAMGDNRLPAPAPASASAPASTPAAQPAAAPPLTCDHLTPWLSATKPVTAIALAQQCEQGRLDLDTPVADHIPAFGRRGKQAVTLRHVLTHTGGFRHARAHYPDDDWDTIIAAACDAPLEPGWTVGRTAGYHALTGWFILGEIVQRVSGERFADYVRGHIFEPLGMNDCWIGIPGERYDHYGRRIAAMWNTAPTTRPPDHPPDHPLDRPPGGRLREEHCVERAPRLSVVSSRAYALGTNPGASGLGPMRQLGRFYEMLLNGGELNGRRIIQPGTVAHFTARHRTPETAGVDKTFGYPMHWGLGFVREPEHRRGRMPYGYGRHASPRTFGHSGNQSSAAFADPAHGLSAAVVFNGMPGEPRHQRRIDAVLTALYEDLDPAVEDSRAYPEAI